MPDADRNSAWLELIQSMTGLALVLFLFTHMLLESSILLGPDAMYAVARFFEGRYLFGQPQPVLVSLIAGGVLLLVVVHAALALRKFPSSYRQYRQFHRHVRSLRHTDTTLWYTQMLTGFALLFLISIHLYSIITQPGSIGPYASADRVWTGRMWPIYLLLLVVVQLHACIGLYRVAMKWFLNEEGMLHLKRKALRNIAFVLIVGFIALGTITLITYINIGIDRQDRAGERYQPETAASRERDGPIPSYSFASGRQAE